jgi:hypothetical protein
MEQRTEQVLAKWQNLISEQGRSGQSAAAFCRDRGVIKHQFFYWKKRLQRSATSQFVAVQIASAKEPTTRAALSTPIEVRLSNGRSLVVAPNFDANHLRALLAVVESES